MKFYGIDMQGYYKAQEYTDNPPAFGAGDERRLIYVNDTNNNEDRVFIGGEQNSGWVRAVLDDGADYSSLTGNLDSLYHPKNGLVGEAMLASVYTGTDTGGVFCVRTSDLWYKLSNTTALTTGQTSGIKINMGNSLLDTDDAEIYFAFNDLTWYLDDTVNPVSGIATHDWANANFIGLGSAATGYYDAGTIEANFVRHAQASIDGVVATLDNGTLVGGLGYSNGTVYPDGGSGVGCQLALTVDGGTGAILSIAIVDGGRSYADTDTLTIPGGDGNGSIEVLTINDNVDNGNSTWQDWDGLTSSDPVVRWYYTKSECDAGFVRTSNWMPNIPAGSTLYATTANTASTVMVRDANRYVYADKFIGIATEAQYADLAEKYTCDESLPVGTVVAVPTDFSDIEYEVMPFDYDLAYNVVGVVSENPAYLMNSESAGLPIALTGKVPVRVVGEVKKGDFLVPSSVNKGCAIKGNFETNFNMKIGVVLETDLQDAEKLVECIIK